MYDIYIYIYIYICIYSHTYEGGGNMITHIDDASASSSSSSSSSLPSSPCLFVSQSAVLPTDLSACKWHSEEEFSISDHRPISSTMVFGRKKSTADRYFTT